MKRWPPDPARTPALVAQRGQFHIAFRLANRFYDIVTGVRSDGLGSLRARKAAARVPLDLMVGLLLHRSRRFALAPRLALDAYDTATTSIAQGNRYTVAAQLGLPLSIEAGLRMGAAGLAVPTANLLAVAAARRRRGLPVGPTTIGWQVLGVGAGAAVAAYERKMRAIALDRHEEMLDAECDLARFAGQNAVATGADSVFDLLIRTGIIIEANVGSRSAVQRELSSWKQALAFESEKLATYLGAALIRWQRHHNDQPVLSRDVELRLAPGDGTVLLTPSQVRQLDDLLDALHLRGSMTVRVLDIDRARRPTTPVHLSVGHHQLLLDPDPHHAPAPPDFGPMTLAVATMLCAIPGLPTQGEVPWGRLGPSILCFAALTLWAYRQVDRYGQEAHQRIYLAGMAACVLQALTTTPAMRSPYDEQGIRAQPHLYPLFAQACLGALYHNEFTRRAQLAAALAAAVSIAAGIGFNRPSLADALMSLAWSGSVLASIRGLAAALDNSAESLSVEIQKGDDAALRSAYSAGHQEVIDILTAAHVKLSQLVDESRASFRSEDLHEIERRLEEIAVRLAAMAPASIGLAGAQSRFAILRG